MPLKLLIDKYSHAVRGRLYAAKGTAITIIREEDDVCIVQTEEGKRFSCRRSEIDFGTGGHDADLCTVGGAERDCIDEQTDTGHEQSGTHGQNSDSNKPDIEVHAEQKPQRPDSNSAQISLFG